MHHFVKMGRIFWNVSILTHKAQSPQNDKQHVGPIGYPASFDCPNSLSITNLDDLNADPQEWFAGLLSPAAAMAH